MLWFDPSFDVSDYPHEKMRQIPWFISGCPGAFTQNLGTHKGEIVRKVEGCHFAAHFHSLRKEKGFDYFRFQLHSGVDDWPETYGGVSGEGIWMASAQPMANGELDFPATLQGMVFCESRPYKNDSRILLIGHGPHSIYKHWLRHFNWSVKIQISSAHPYSAMMRRIVLGIWWRRRREQWRASCAGLDAYFAGFRLRSDPAEFGFEEKIGNVP